VRTRAQLRVVRGYPDRAPAAQALASLRAGHREVLIECYYGGRSVAAAAAHLGLAPSEVKSRLYYALKSLRVALEERHELD
jgi:RNA polymerase sigma-70 factor, ECF subfamily